MKVIQSRDNPYYKELVKLSGSARQRGGVDAERAWIRESSSCKGEFISGGKSWFAPIVTKSKGGAHAMEEAC